MIEPEVKVLMLKGDKGDGLSDDDVAKVKEQIETSVASAEVRISDGLNERITNARFTPKAFQNADAIKDAYPNGADGIFIASDTGHMWLFVNGKWVDAGVYQALGLEDSVIGSVELIKPDKAADLDANSVKGNSIYRLLNVKGSTTVTANTPFGGVWQSDAVCLLETIGQSNMVGTIQLFITVADGRVYRRTYTTAGWTNWLLLWTDRIKSVDQVITPATSASFDFDSAEKNTVVRILLDQNSTLPAHTPFDKYPGGIGILETWGDGLGSIQKYTQVYKDMTQDTSIWYRYKATRWYSWYKANVKPEERGKIKVEVGKGKQYKTLKSGIEAAMNSKPGETEVIVYPGTYDLIEEFGDAYFEALASGAMNGLMVGDGLTLTFLAGSHVKANYAGNNPAVMKGFSPFNSSRGDLYISGLDLECSRVRYGFHDEKASRPEPYRMHMKDCKIYMDNTQNTAWAPRQCIGGGLGEHGEILIGRCTFESKDISGGVVSYHNGNTEDCESSITIYDCYIGGSNRAFFGFGYRGASTKVTKINLTGNSWPTAPYVHPEVQGEPNVNMALARVYNNELRN